jgi:two-component system, response regulator PdtaR
MKPARIDITLHRDTIPGSDTAARTRSARRILIVEDNFFVAHQCQSALNGAGYEVVGIVTSADDAVREALARRPSLVLMDIYLVGARDGIDAALEIFERAGIRSIFASALADAAGKARADAAQPLAWLAKPFSNRRLIATVTSAMEDVGASEPTQA